MPRGVVDQPAYWTGFKFEYEGAKVISLIGGKRRPLTDPEKG